MAFLGIRNSKPETAARMRCGVAGVGSLGQHHARIYASLPGVELVTDAFFNEFTVKLPKPAGPVVDALVQKGVIAGVPASRLLPKDKAAANLLILAATETNTDDDFDALVNALKEAI